MDAFIPFTKNWSEYRWRDHSPVLDLIDTLIEDSGLPDEEVARRGLVSVGTIKRWRRRQVKRPLESCVTGVLRGLGYEVGVRKIGGGTA